MGWFRFGSGSNRRQKGSGNTGTPPSTAIASFEVDQIPATVTQGDAQTVRVRARRVGGQTKTDYVGTITFTSSDGAATLPSNYQFQLSDAGIKTFTNGVTFNTAGTQSVTVTDTVATSATGSQSGITVQAETNVADHLAFVVQPSNVIENQAISPAVVVEVQNALNSAVTGDTSTVTLTIQTGTGSITNASVACVNGVATFSNLTLDTVQTGVILQAARTGLTSINSNAFNVLVTPSETIQVATTPWRPMPQPHENWTPTYTNSFTYKMAPGEIMPFWFRVNSNAAVTLALGGTDADKFTAEFFKPFGYTVDNSNQYARASLSSSPTGTYYDPLNPIPAGSSNFTPESAGVNEIVYLALQCKATTAGNADYTIQINFGNASVTGTIHVWSNVTIPPSPTVPLLMEMPGGYANEAINNGYVSETEQATIAGRVTDLLIKYRVTPYKNSNTFLAVSGSTLNIDNLSANGASFRQLLLNKVHSSAIKFWMSSPQTQTAHRTLAYAQAAQATINAEGLTNMYLYVWDEPSTDVTTATNIKSILDNWSSGSPGTKLFLTTDHDYDQSAGAISAGLNFGDYGTQLVLCPVVNRLKSPYPDITTYTNGATATYAACQDNCQTRLNTNTTPGSDTGYADIAYVDFPAVRKYAMYLLLLRSTFRDKLVFMLHYNSVEAWIDYNGSTTTIGQNSWLSSRRFGVMGDGTVVFPTTPGYQPHSGLPAFSTEKTAVPSIRLLYLAHASFMADMFEQYFDAQASNLANDLVTDGNNFVTDISVYEQKRAQIGDALEAGGAVVPNPPVAVRFETHPSNAGTGNVITPAITVSVVDEFNTIVTTDNTTQITLSIASGTGTLGGTLTRTCSSGIATFNDIVLNSVDTFTLQASATGLTPDTSNPFDITAGGLGEGSDLNDITSLAHWWRADTVVESGGNITQWTNKKTSNTNHLTTTGTNHSTPAYNATGGPGGKPTAIFTAANKDMSHDISFASVSTTAAYVGVVYKVDNTATGGGILGSIDRNADYSLRYTTTKIASIDVAENAAGTWRDAAPAVDTNWHWALFRIKNASGNTKLWVDGNLEVNSTAEGDVQVVNIRIGALLTDNTLGNGSADSVSYGNVRICDVFIFNHTFNETTDFATLVTYMAERYGLGA